MVNMKIKIICQKDNFKEYSEMLERGGFTISNDADLIFKEVNYTQETIVGKYNNRYEIIPYQEIIYVESFGHEIILHALDKEYSIKEKLFEIEGMYIDKGFIRINKSCVVNKFQIKEIKPTFNTRLELIMKNNAKLYVTRTYYNQFKEYIGF
jgi:two-component system response regulator LytT